MWALIMVVVVVMLRMIVVVAFGLTAGEEAEEVVDVVVDEVGVGVIMTEVAAEEEGLVTVVLVMVRVDRVVGGAMSSMMITVGTAGRRERDVLSLNQLPLMLAVVVLLIRVSSI
jgi:hypothetical protein